MRPAPSDSRPATSRPARQRGVAVVTALLLTTLAIDVVRIARYSFGADTLDARAETVARQGLPRGAGEGDSARMLADRLARLRGPGEGFSATAAAVFQIVQASPGSEVTALQFDPNGSMRVTLSTAGEAEANAIKKARGGEKEISLTRSERCADCGGSGAKAGTQPLACPDCRGTGQKQDVKGRVISSWWWRCGLQPTCLIASGCC